MALADLGSTQGFVGRGPEMAELGAALEELCAGRGSLCLIGGEPGIGKTRLAAELGRRAAAVGVRVQWSRCHEVEGRPPYWPWLQVIQAQARQNAAEAVADVLGRAALPLGRLVPELRPHLPESPPVASAGSDTDTARFLLFEGMATFLRRITQAEPCLLILDDLHRADLPSLLLLDFLAHDLAEMRLLIVATYRDVEFRGEPFLDAVVSRICRKAMQVPLHGLTLDETEVFIEIAAGVHAPAAVVERLHRETEGNPFFLDELARLFRRRGDWNVSGSIGLPISLGVRGAIEQRLAPLAPETRDLLATAAVAGREFDLPLLEAATAIPRPALLGKLSPALELEIVNAVPGRPGDYRFSHALVREAIYDEIPVHERAELHRRFGEILERRSDALDGALAEIAHHFFCASASGGEEKAIEYAERAGHQALSSLAYEDAAEQFGRALHLTELGSEASPRRACELLLALGEARNRAGQGDASAQALRRAAALARRIASGELLARAATGLSDVGSGWAEFGRSDATLVQILQEALEQLGPDQAPLRARVMARLATELCWAAPASRTEELSGEAVRIARTTGDGTCVAYALLARIHCLSGPDRVAERLRLVDEVVAYTQGRGDLAVNGLLWRLGDELQMGRMAAVDVCRESLVHAVRDARQPGYLWLVPAVRSQQALLEGRFEEAESYIAEMSSPSTRLANTDQAASALAFLIQREQGRHRDLVPALEGLAQQYPALAVWRSALAMLHAEIGELGEAHAALEAVMSAGLDSLRLDVGWLSNMAFLAEACRACGTAAEAARLYELLLPYQGRNVVAGPLYYMGPIDYYLGILAAATERPVQAAKHLAVALEAARAAGALPYVARILIAHAAIAEGNRGQEDRHAAEMRREGLEIANSLGMSAVVGLAERGVSRAASTSRRASEAATVEHADAIEHAAAAVEQADAASLQREGGFWTLRYRGRTSRLKDLRGLLYLSRLLASPGVEIHALDLAAEGAGSSNRGVPTSEGDLGPILDARAKAEIRRRLADLREREEDAERNNDWQGAARARAEIEQLADELSSAVGLAGRDRRPGSAGERARASVTKAIRAAIQMIERSDPGLADILSRTVRTGIFCSYDPLDEMPLSWNVAVDSEARATRRGGS